MPRLIDHEARNAEISAAALRVLERNGLAALSVRGVAEEAGIAPASLRRAFPTQHALREHCFDLIEQRATMRIRALPERLAGRPLAEAVLAQLLPLDRERRSELIAQIQLGVLALTDGALQPAALRLHSGVGRACASAIRLLDEAGLLGAGRDPEREARRLRAVLDGLAMHAIWAGGAEDPERMLDVLGQHFDELALAAQRN